MSVNGSCLQGQLPHAHTEGFILEVQNETAAAFINHEHERMSMSMSMSIEHGEFPASWLWLLAVSSFVFVSSQFYPFSFWCFPFPPPLPADFPAAWPSSQAQHLSKMKSGHQHAQLAPGQVQAVSTAIASSQLSTVARPSARQRGPRPSVP